MVRAVLFLIVGVLVFVARVPTALRLLNPQYGAMGATGAIALLAADGVTPRTPWCGSHRARRNVMIPLTRNVVAVVAMARAMLTLVRSNGAFGRAVALFLTQLLLNAGIAAHYLVTHYGVKRVPWFGGGALR
jgi:hypothetical protein